MSRSTTSFINTLLTVSLLVVIAPSTMIDGFVPSHPTTQSIAQQSMLRSKLGHKSAATLRSLPVPSAIAMASTDSDEDSSRFDSAAASSKSSNTPETAMSVAAAEEKQANNEKKKPINPTSGLVSMLKNALNSNKQDGNNDSAVVDGIKLTSMQLVAAVAAFALAFTPVNDAEAAMSGGRMGGSFSSSASRPSISRSVPSSSSYSRGYSRGYSSGYMSRPSVSIAPSIGYGYGYGGGYSPFLSPFSPFGAAVAPRVYGGPGVISLSRGPSIFNLLVPLFFVVAAQNVLRSFAGESSSVFGESGLAGTTTSSSSALGPGTSVAQLSVALEVPNRDDRNSILSVLDRISQTARTDSRVGIQNLTSQVALEVLRRKSSIVSGSSSNKHFRNQQQALREFQNRSIKERSKFETETVNKFGGVDYGGNGSKSFTAPDGSSNKATMAVVTFVIAIDGDQTKLNQINSITDVEQALRKIASDAKTDDCLQNVEILWTPEDRSETLGLRDIIADYPQLRSI